MVVGAARVELRVHGSRSLKQKRGVVRAISQRLRNRFNLAVAEVGGQDTWQRAVIGLSTVGGDAGSVRRRLEKAFTFIEDQHLAEVVDQELELLEAPIEDEAPPARSAGPDLLDELEEMAAREEEGR